MDFLGESEGSFPQPHDSLPDAGEAINDFWSMSGSFIYRHHVEPRVKLYSPSEESFPIPLKYIDVSRTTHTNLDVKQEKRIDDYWNIDGSREFFDPWIGFTQFTLLEEKPPDGYMWSGEETDEKAAYIQAKSFMARALEVNGKARQAEGECGMNTCWNVCMILLRLLNLEPKASADDVRWAHDYWQDHGLCRERYGAGIPTHPPSERACTLISV